MVPDRCIPAVFPCTCTFRHHQTGAVAVWPWKHCYHPWFCSPTLCTPAVLVPAVLPCIQDWTASYEVKSPFSFFLSELLVIAEKITFRSLKFKSCKDSFLHNLQLVRQTFPSFLFCVLGLCGLSILRIQIHLQSMMSFWSVSYIYLIECFKTNSIKLSVMCVCQIYQDFDLQQNVS